MLLRAIATAVLLLPLCFSPALAAEAERPLTLGVHPYLSATELVRRFTPLAEYIQRQTNRQVSIVVSSDYEQHIHRVGKDELDIAYLGPASYVRMVELYGKKPILARLEVDGSPTFQGMIVVSRDSDIKSLKDIAGKRFAFGDPNSTMSHLVPRYMLTEAGVDVGKLAHYEFIDSHDNVALGVLVGDFDAGAVKEEVFYEYEGRGLRELARTPEVSEHVFVASAELRTWLVRKLRMSLYALDEDPEGMVVMTSVKKTITAMVPASDSDYDNLRTIMRSLEQGEARQ